MHEALCRGLPAIVTACAGVAERYPADLRHCLLLNPDDAGELAERLRYWRLNLAQLREAVLPLSSALRSRTWDAMASEIVTHVERAA